MEKGSNMMSKQELTRMLRDASDLEEGVIGFLTDYIRLYFDWSGFPKDTVTEIKGMLDRIRSDSERHYRMVENLLTWVSDRGEDEF
jgi:rubrerythrin